MVWTKKHKEVGTCLRAQALLCRRAGHCYLCFQLCAIKEHLCTEEARKGCSQSLPLGGAYSQLPWKGGRELGTHRESSDFWDWIEVRRDLWGLVIYEAIPKGSTGWSS